MTSAAATEVSQTDTSSIRPWKPVPSVSAAAPSVRGSEALKAGAVAKPAASKAAPSTMSEAPAAPTETRTWCHWPSFRNSPETAVAPPPVARTRPSAAVQCRETPSRASTVAPGAYSRALRKNPTWKPAATPRAAAVPSSA